MGLGWEEFVFSLPLGGCPLRRSLYLDWHVMWGQATPLPRRKYIACGSLNTGVGNEANKVNVYAGGCYSGRCQHILNI